MIDIIRDAIDFGKMDQEIKDLEAMIDRYVAEFYELEPDSTPICYAAHHAYKQLTDLGRKSLDEIPCAKHVFLAGMIAIVGERGRTSPSNSP